MREMQQTMSKTDKPKKEKKRKKSPESILFRNNGSNSCVGEIRLEKREERKIGTELLVFSISLSVPLKFYFLTVL